MAGNPVQAQCVLLHFHSCTHCGDLFRRNEFDDRAISSGSYPCAHCGQEGPLNIVIRKIEDLSIAKTCQSSG
jgi:hypothetical protein